MTSCHWALSLDFSPTISFCSYIVRIDPRFLSISLSFYISSLRVKSLIIAHVLVCHDHQSTSASISVHFRFYHLLTSMSMYVRLPSSASIPVHLYICISDYSVFHLSNQTLSSLQHSLRRGYDMHIEYTWSDNTFRDMSCMCSFSVSHLHDNASIIATHDISTYR